MGINGAHVVVFSYIQKVYDANVVIPHYAENQKLEIEI